MIKLLSAVAVAVAAVPAGAVSLAVVNPSFETITPGTFLYGCGTGCSYSIAPIAGWTNGGNTGQFTPGPAAGNFTYFNSIPDGITVAYTNGAPITQTLAATAVAGRTYTLSTFLGFRKDYIDPGFIALTVGGTTVYATGLQQQFSGDWSLYTTSYTATAADAGGAIIVTLGGDVQGDFDAVSVTATVPEPATWALLIAGFAMTGVAARRRRTAPAA